MKNTKNKSVKIRSILAIALVAVMIITTASCSKSGGGGGGKSLNSAEDLKAYLDKQPANSPDKPIKIAMKLNEPMFPKVREVIDDAGKYVSLDLSGSPITTIPDRAFYGCEPLVGIIIPNGVTRIEENALYYTVDSITIGAGVDVSNSIGSFTITYNFGGKQAGTYTYKDGTWTKQ